jgi:protein-S-isoprenylcysteine O-methyltransferase Ste14
MRILFIISFIICLIGYLVHTFVHWLESQQGRAKSSAEQDRIVNFFVHAGYVGWGLMIFSDQSSIGLPLDIILPIGLLIGIIGMIIFLLSVSTKMGYTQVDKLITHGIYKKIRHPMYLGIILIHIGFPLAFSRLLTLLSAILWIPMILYWRYLEEKELEARFGQAYRDYRKRTFF